MDLKFKIDGDRYLDEVTWDMQIEMGKGEMTPETEKRLCSIFLVDEGGNYYPPDQADKILGGLPMRKVKEATQALNEEISRMMGGASPLAATIEPPS
jgi:hypothetical protein